MLTIPAEGWKNKGGTAVRPPCGCGSWKSHWLKCSGEEWPDVCSFVGCTAEPTLGAHIFRSGNDTPDDEYIVPACSACNNDHDAVFDLKENVVLVSANRQKICG